MTRTTQSFLAFVLVRLSVVERTIVACGLLGDDDVVVSGGSLVLGDGGESGVILGRLLGSEHSLWFLLLDDLCFLEDHVI